jgi:hypothetical protein
VSLDGTLELAFVQPSDAKEQVGRTFDLFDWTGVTPSGSFSVASDYDWDLSRLYSLGQVTLLAAGGRLAADANADGRVDLDDFGVLKDHFGEAGGIAEGDANRSGFVDLEDFGLLKLNFGEHGMTAVPEPSAWILSMLAVAALSGHACRRRRVPFAARGSVPS